MNDQFHAPPPASGRLIGAANATLGALLLGRARWVVAAAGPTPAAGWVRLLGVRYLLQGAAALVWPVRAVLAGSGAADGLHAASMVALAAGSHRYRRPASLSAAVAAGGAVATTLVARRMVWGGR